MSNMSSERELEDAIFKLAHTLFCYSPSLTIKMLIVFVESCAPAGGRESLFGLHVSQRDVLS